MNSSGKRGFTLIELSVAFVIIALLAGSVLVGSDMILGARSRSQISQIKSYDAAANIFLEKYRFLPGDIPDQFAQKLGLQLGSPLYSGHGGNGNGIIEDGSYTLVGGEASNFWVHLGQMQLIPGSYTLADANTQDSNVSQYLPPAKLGAGMYVYTEGQFANQCTEGIHNGVHDVGINYMGIVGADKICGYNPCFTNYSYSIPVKQAYDIDAKIDDGMPNSGKVMTQAPGASGYFLTLIGAQNCSWDPSGLPSVTTAATPGTAQTCYDNNNVNGAPMQYSMKQAGGAGANCALTFEMSQ